jgi:hypothetical protein
MPVSRASVETGRPLEVRALANSQPYDVADVSFRNSYFSSL